MKQKAAMNNCLSNWSDVSLWESNSTLKKDFFLNFSDEASDEIFANTPGIFMCSKLDNAPIRINTKSKVSTIVLFAAIIAGALVVFAVLMRKDGLLKKRRRDTKDNNLPKL